MAEQHAYVVTVEPPSPHPLISHGADIAEAADRATAALGGARILGMEWIGRLVPEEPAQTVVPKRTADVPTIAPAPEGGTRAQQLALLLDREGRPLHIDEIASAFATSTANAHNITRAALDAGFIERVGSRTGKVRRVVARKAPRPKPTPGPKPPPRPAPAPKRELSPFMRRVLKGLRAIGAAGTAKDVATYLGCRPREAGNALALLVEAGRVTKDASVTPTSYRVGKPRRG